MKIAVLSGKGGTGKTTLATNLAAELNLGYVDLDVEEPNGHLFLHPQWNRHEAVTVPTPAIDPQTCTACGRCVSACQFNALVRIGKTIKVFEDLCHGCGACSLACGEGAITEVGREIGTVSIGETGSGLFMNGLMHLSEPMAGPIIRRIQDLLDPEADVIVDCAPGTSCNVVKALLGANYAVLVTEPSRFGLHDLQLAVQLVEEMGIPHGIVINRSNEYDPMILEFAAHKGIEVLGAIPFSREAALQYSEGRLLAALPGYDFIFGELGNRIKEAAYAVRHHQR